VLVSDLLTRTKGRYSIEATIIIDRLGPLLDEFSEYGPEEVLEFDYRVFVQGCQVGPQDVEFRGVFAVCGHRGNRKTGDIVFVVLFLEFFLFCKGLLLGARLENILHLVACCGALLVERRVLLCAVERLLGHGFSVVVE
jgi:hypothetical protein